MMAEIFQQAIQQVEPSNFNQDAYQQIWQLYLSHDLSSILQTIKVNEGTNAHYIYGEPGSGCTTLIEGLCQHLCKTNTTTESDILYLSLSEGCNKTVFWSFMSQLAKEKNDTAKVALFSTPSVKISEKKEGLVEFLQQHFKVICINNAGLCGNFVEFVLGDALKICKITSFVVCYNLQVLPERLHSSNFASTTTVYGLCDSAATELASKRLQSLSLTDNEISNLCSLVKCNPVALELVCALLNSKEENVITSLLKKDSTAIQNNIQTSCALEMVLEWTSRVLKVSSIGMLSRLCHLRRPLPMLCVPSEMEELVQLKLLLVKQEGSIQCIYLHSTLKKYLSYKKDFYSDSKLDFDVLCHWLALVSNQELHKLIKQAEEHAWPFVPESWQFIADKDVGKKESFNVKEHIISKNAHIPSLTELEILYECVYHAYLQNNFQKLAAITFVLDRFHFWQGDKKTSMAIVNYIQKNNPQTAIAPQLLVRRARFMKNEGNLRGAEKVLDEVSRDKERVGNWKYKFEFQSELTRAACIQLKGEIQYSLGNWLKSASLLLESIELFANLPNPDKKGLSLGYGLLCPCLRNMTFLDYSTLAQDFGLVKLHPLLAAYISSQEAARSSTYTPMFFVRHICHAGDVLLQFIKLSTLKEEKQKLLRVAIEDLKDSIQAHQTYKSLASIEQFYYLVLASFKLSLALMELETQCDQKVGHSLKAIAGKLYEHYCSSSGNVIVDDQVIELIDKCLDLLNFKKYHSEDLPDAGQILLKFYKLRSDQRLKENTRLAVEGLFVNNKKMPVSPGSPEMFIYSQSSFPNSPTGDKQQHLQHLHEIAPALEEENAKNKARPEKGSTVDRCALTVEGEARSNTEDVSRPEKGDTVDRCALTVEEETEQEEVMSSTEEDTSRPKKGETVDRCALTVEEETEQEEVMSSAEEDTSRPKKGETVDRCALTVEESVSSVIKEDGSDKTVDQRAVEKQEEEQNPKPAKAIIKDKTADRNTFTEEDENRSKTVDEYAFLMSRSVENDSGVIIQSLEDEAVSLPSQMQHQIPLHFFGEVNPEEDGDKSKRARDGILWKYDFPSRQWRYIQTMVFLGDPLELKKGLEGAQRDVFAVKFINQDEPLQRYVAKRYRKKIHHQQYENDVLSQMTARHYVATFNRELSKAAAGVSIGEIQFLPVVLLQLVNSSGHVTEVLNAEPYMSGEFTKLTNNVDWKNERRRTDLVLAYSHFTYQASDGKLIIVDIQGWAPHDNKGCTFLTDPQIHSPVYKCFGTGNLGKRGFEKFWTELHSECNEICRILHLRRPSAIEN